MRRVVGAVVGLVCVGLLSSCSLASALPPSTIFDDNKQLSDIVMQHIADAVKNHDAAALKKLFSTTARQKATDLDSGLAYFLSVFPSGRMTWESEGTGSGGQETVELFADYKVSANGKEYDVYFTDFPFANPDYVGIYSLGVTPYNAHPATAPTAASTAFDSWESTFTPGVYVP
jgi:hypothetical protein